MDNIYNYMHIHTHIYNVVYYYIIDIMLYLGLRTISKL